MSEQPTTREPQIRPPTDGPDDPLAPMLPDKPAPVIITDVVISLPGERAILNVDGLDGPAPRADRCHLVVFQTACRVGEGPPGGFPERVYVAGHRPQEAWYVVRDPAEGSDPPALLGDVRIATLRCGCEFRFDRLRWSESVLRFTPVLGVGARRLPDRTWPVYIRTDWYLSEEQVREFRCRGRRGPRCENRSGLGTRILFFNASLEFGSAGGAAKGPAGR